MRSILIAAASVALMAPVLADPQTADMSPVPTLHAETRVVQIDVIVKDAHGKPVTELTKSDFTVTDNGKPRKIDIFSINRGSGNDKQTPAIVAAPTAPKQPLAANVYSNRNQGPPNIPGHSTVIVLDQVNAFFEDAGYARQQVMDLMSKLKPDERIALYVIARKQGLTMIQDYTADHALVLKNLAKYAPRGLMPRHGISEQDLKSRPTPPGVPPAHPTRGDDGKLRQQIPERELEYTFQENSTQARLSLQALAEHLALVPGRKSVYWVTQGFPARLMQGMGQFAWDKTITALNEANVAVNTVDSRGLFNCGPPPICNPRDPLTGTITTLQEVAEETGGNAYFDRNDLDAAIAEGIESSRTTYTLAFYLADNERDNKFHALKVGAVRANLQLFHRQGYYAGDTEMPEASKDKASGGELESALLNQVDSSDVGITARVELVPGSPRQTVTIHLTLDPATLSFREQSGARVGSVEEMVVERDDIGRTLGKMSDKKEFEVTGTNGAGVNGSVVGWPFSLPLAEGTSKLMIVVRDTQSGRVGSLTVPLK